MNNENNVLFVAHVFNETKDMLGVCSMLVDGKNSVSQSIAKMTECVKKHCPNAVYARFSVNNSHNSTTLRKL